MCLLLMQVVNLLEDQEISGTIYLFNLFYLSPLHISFRNKLKIQTNGVVVSKLPFNHSLL